MLLRLLSTHLGIVLTVALWRCSRSSLLVPRVVVALLLLVTWIVVPLLLLVTWIVVPLLLIVLRVVVDLLRRCLLLPLPGVVVSPWSFVPRGLFVRHGRAAQARGIRYAWSAIQVVL